MAARWTFCAILWGLSASAAVADIWSPSTWIPHPGSKKGSVSVAKSHKKSSTSHSLTGHKSPGSKVAGLASTPHDFLEKTKTIMSPAKSKKPVTATKRTSPKNEKPSLFKSMFSPEPPPPPQTVKEWLALKRPN